MKITKYRFLALIYPHLSFEVEVLDGDKKYYVNMDVNSNQEKEEILCDSWWSYKVPLDEVDFSVDDEEYIAYDKDFTNILAEMLSYWNKNLPKFVQDGWHDWPN